MDNFGEKVSASLEELAKTEDGFVSFDIMGYYLDVLNLGNSFFIEACSEENQPKRVQGSNKKFEEYGFIIDPDGSGNYVRTDNKERIEGFVFLIEEIFSKAYQRDIKGMDLNIEKGIIEE